MEKTIAVIVPCFSYGHYLTEALESLAQQTKIPDEIIIVSDGAIDNSVQIAQQFKDKHKDLNIIILEKENGGLASARNAGIKLANSEYIMSFDSDDILRTQAIEKHLELADKHSIVTLPLMAFGSESYTARPREATVDILLQTNVIYSNSVFPKQAWIDVNGFDESEIMRKGWEDRECWLRMLGAGYKSVIGEDVALLWRRHPKTMSSTSADPNHKILQDYIYNKNKHLLNRPQL
jgi:glycosyltransferase involved in cell wall biosynthesis